MGCTQPEAGQAGGKVRTRSQPSVLRSGCPGGARAQHATVQAAPSGPRADGRAERASQAAGALGEPPPPIVRAATPKQVRRERVSPEALTGGDGGGFKYRHLVRDALSGGRKTMRRGLCLPCPPKENPIRPNARAPEETAGPQIVLFKKTLTSTSKTAIRHPRSKAAARRGGGRSPSMTYCSQPARRAARGNSGSPQVGV